MLSPQNYVLDDSTKANITNDNFIMFCKNVDPNDMILIYFLLSNQMYSVLLDKILNYVDYESCQNIMAQLIIYHELVGDKFIDWINDIKSDSTKFYDLVGGFETDIKWLLSDGILKISNKIKEFMAQEIPMAKRQTIDENLKQGAIDRKIYKQKLLNKKL